MYIYIMERKCYKCQKDFPIEEFTKYKARKDGLSIYCKKCMNEKIKQSREKKFGPIPEGGRRPRTRSKHLAYKPGTAEYKRNTFLICVYNITLEEYNNLVIKQEGRCAICSTKDLGKHKKLYVDHDHITKKVRGLLCKNCNLGLGYFKDNTVSLLKAVEYLTLKV